MKKILFSCDNGLGDFIVSLPALLSLAQNLELSPVFFLGALQAEYLLLFPCLQSIETYYDLCEIPISTEFYALYSVRSKKSTLTFLKTLSRSLGVRIYYNLLHEDRLSFLYRRLLSNYHYSELPSLFMMPLVSSFFRNYRRFCTYNYLVPPPTDLIPVSQILLDYPKAINRYVLLSPAGQDPQRVLTYEQISLLASMIEAPIVVVGNNSLLDVPTGSNIINMFGITSLHQSISLIANATLAICMDSALAHIANAYLSVPSIVIMGNASPSRWGPLPTHQNTRLVYSNAACSPCRQVSCKKYYNKYSCMQLPIVVRSIVQAISELSCGLASPSTFP